MKNVIAGAAAALLVAAGLVVASPGAEAEAHTPSHTVDCSALSVDLKSYAPLVPAVEGVDGQDYIAPTYEMQPNPDYVPASESYIEHEAVTHLEYKFVHKFLSWLVKWSANPDWNAESNPNSKGFEATGETRVVEDEAAWTETVSHPAVGAEFIEVMTDPGQEAIEAVVAVPAKVNTLVVTIDGVVVEDIEFGGNFAATYNFDSTVAHDWSIVVTAWDNAKYNYDRSGTTVPCYVPNVPAMPTLTTTPPTCDALYNQFVFEGASEDVRFLIGDIRIKAEDIVAAQANGVSVEDALAAYGIPAQYGTITLEAVWYDRHTKEDVSLGNTTVTLVDPATVDCTPAYPGDKVVVGEWVDGAYECDATEVEQTRVTTTTPFVLVDNVWVEGEPVVGEPETQVRPLTEEEIAEAACPIVTPEEPVAPNPATPVTPSVDKLAYTGFPVVGSLLGALASIMAGLGLVVARRIRA